MLQAGVGKFEDEESWVSLQRECYIRYKNEWVPYPFQNNLYCIPKQDQVDCLLGLVQAKVEQCTELQRRPKNFDEWIVQTMGEGLANVFMRPYNFKVWAIPCELMSSTWLGERVSVVDYSRAIRNTILEQRDAGWGPNATFRFPKRAGGTGAIWQGVADNMLPTRKCRYNTKLIHVDLDKKIAKFEDGSTVAYEKLISTMPLDLFLSVATTNTRTLPSCVDDKVKLLVHSSTNVLGFGVRGANPHGTKCWLYFPEANCPFYRATVFSNYSPNNVPNASALLPTLRLAGGNQDFAPTAEPQPGPYWSIMLEVSESVEHKPVNQAELIADALRGCINAGLLMEQDEIVSIYHSRLEHGYPTPSLQRDEAVQALLPLLQNEFQVWSRGRFGSWKYEVGNQDHSLVLGVEAVDNVLQVDKTESTLNQSNLVNARGKNSTPRFLGVVPYFTVAGDPYPTHIKRLGGLRFTNVESYVAFVSGLVET